MSAFYAPTDAAILLARARNRVRTRAAATVPVDYPALNVMVRRQRAALTRAIHSGNPDNVVAACANAVREWQQPGAMWPDDWSRWQRALDDALPFGQSVEIGELA